MSTLVLVPIKFQSDNTRGFQNLIPMFGQKISVTHDGMPRICKDCLTYQKRGVKCTKKDWQSNVTEFKEDHPKIPEVKFGGDKHYHNGWLDGKQEGKVKVEWGY